MGWAGLALGVEERGGGKRKDLQIGKVKKTKRCGRLITIFGQLEKTMQRGINIEVVGWAALVA